MPHKYKSKDGKDFFVPGVGASENGVLYSDAPLEAANLEEVTESTPTAPIQGQQVAQPGAVIGVAPQATVTPQPAAAPVQSIAPQTQTPEENK